MSFIRRSEDQAEELYEWWDGELVAGCVLGWNFGDGHLHNRALLQAIQAKCAFEPGELRCIMVEAQPMGGNAMAYVIADAASGIMERGQIPVAPLLALQPWPPDAQ